MMDFGVGGYSGQVKAQLRLVSRVFEHLRRRPAARVSMDEITCMNTFQLSAWQGLWSELSSSMLHMLVLSA